jgi:precorrin-6B methylase 2
MNNIKDNSEFSWLWSEDGAAEGLQKFRGIIRMHGNEASLLYKYCKLITGNVVEIGRAFGGSLYIIASTTSGKVYSIDKNSLNSSLIKKFSSATAERLLRKFSKFSNIIMIDQPSETVQIQDTYDLLFIDGGHRFENVLQDTINYWNNLTTYAIYHDYHTEGVKAVVNAGVKCKLFEIIETADVKQSGRVQPSTIVVRKLNEIDVLEVTNVNE